MTGNDILKRVKHLSGNFNAQCGAFVETQSTEGLLEIINQILSDLKCNTVSSLADELNIPPAKAEALCYGAAMLRAFRDGDSNRNSIFTEIYNAKRSAALAEISYVSDRIPKTAVE